MASKRTRTKKSAHDYPRLADGSIDWDAPLPPEIAKKVASAFAGLPATMAAIEDALNTDDLRRQAEQHAPRPDPEPEKPKGGRPPKAFVPKLAAAGGSWLAVHGAPDKQADLERHLLDVCQERSWPYSERQVRNLAKELIQRYRLGLAGR